MSKRLQDRILKIYQESNRENQDEFMDKPSNFLGGNLNPELQARIREIYKASQDEDLTQFTDAPSLFLGGSIQERMKQIYSEQIQDGGKLELIDSIQKDLRKMKSDVKKGKGINRTTKAIQAKVKDISRKAKSIDDTYKLSTIANRALMAFPEKREKLEKSTVGKKAVEYVQRRAQIQKPTKEKVKDLKKMIKQKREEELFTDNPETEQSFIDDQYEKLNTEIETYYDDQGIPYYYDPITDQTYYGEGLKRRVGRPCKTKGGAMKKRSRISDIQTDPNIIPYFEQPLFDSPKERLYREKKILDNERRKLERDKLKLEQEKEKSKLGEEIKRQKMQLGQLKKQQSDLRKRVTKEVEKQNLTKTQEKEAVRRDKELEKQLKLKEKEIEKLNRAKAITSKSKVRIRPSSSSRYEQQYLISDYIPEEEYIDIEPEYDPYLEQAPRAPPPPPLSLMQESNEPMSEAQLAFLERKKKSPQQLEEEKQQKEAKKKKKKETTALSFAPDVSEVIDVKKKLKKVESKAKQEFNPPEKIILQEGKGLKKPKRKNTNGLQKGSQEAKDRMAYIRSLRKNQ